MALYSKDENCKKGICPFLPNSVPIDDQLRYSVMLILLTFSSNLNRWHDALSNLPMFWKLVYSPCFAICKHYFRSGSTGQNSQTTFFLFCALDGFENSNGENWNKRYELQVWNGNIPHGMGRIYLHPMR